MKKPWKTLLLIRMTQPFKKTLALEDYIPKYFLEFETRDSQTFVNIEAMFDPWNYKLRVWDGFTYDTEQAIDILKLSTI